MNEVSMTLFDMPEALPGHPAKYTDVLLPTMARMLKGCKRILDTFGGTGRVFLLENWLPDAQIEAIELEPEFAAHNPRITVGNALHLPWPDGYFDAICTSPTYGNRMADSLRNPENWAREYRYITYAQKLNRRLHPDNSGSMQWGKKYRDFHYAFLLEAMRVLTDTFVLNMKDHYRNGELQHVTDWWIETMCGLGFNLVEHKYIDTPSMRYGANSELRVEYESVILFRR